MDVIAALKPVGKNNSVPVGEGSLIVQSPVGSAINIHPVTSYVETAFYNKLLKER